MKIKLTLKQIRGLFLGFAFLLLAVGLGYWLGSHRLAFLWYRPEAPQLMVKTRQPEDQLVDFSLYWEVWENLERSFFDQNAIDSKEMVYGSIKGMIGALGDPYTAFLTPEENTQSKEDLEGSFGGVGIQIGFKDGSLAVIAPLTGMPAERAGVSAGDLILAIDGEATLETTLPEAVRLIRGPQGSEVRLTLLREGEAEPYEVVIVRGEIVVPSVELELLAAADNQKVAHLKLMRFGDSTNDEWQEAIGRILMEPKLLGVILDLRNNPGGYLLGSPYVAAEFLKDGKVVIQEDADGQKEDYLVERTGKLTAVPLVVLINQGSASASEIVAGALQHYRRAKLVGEPTFGKGTIQEAQELAGGAGLHVTTHRWLLPSGESIDKEGIKPDYQIKDDLETEADEPLEKAIEVLVE